MKKNKIATFISLLFFVLFYIRYESTVMFRTKYYALMHLNSDGLLAVIFGLLFIYFILKDNNRKG